MTNPLAHKYLVWSAKVRGAGCAVLIATLACGGSPKLAQQAEPKPTAPLPTAGLAGQRVSLFPITLVAAEDSLNWNEFLADRRGTLDRVDSLIADLIPGRAPEVTWVLPHELRAAARRSGGIAPPPEQTATAILRAEGMTDVPDPLRSQLRALVALAGGRYALIPAALIYRRQMERPDAGESSQRAAGTEPSRPGAEPASATAELSVVMVDVRLGKVGWRTIARGVGTDPWSALVRALKELTPGVP